MKIDQPKQVWQLAFEGEWPTSVAFLGSSTRLVAGNRGGELLLWDLPEDAAAVPETGSDEDPGSDKASGANENPATGGQSKDAAAPRDCPPRRKFVGHTNGISRLVATRDGSRFFSASLDRTVRVWDPLAPANGAAQVVLDRTARERRAKSSPADQRDGILNAPGTEVEAVEPLAVLDAHRDWVKGLGVSGDERRLISGDDACETIVWDLPGLQPVARWKGYDRVWVTSAALSPDGELAFTAEYATSRGSFDRPAAQARFWNAGSGSLQRDLLKVWLPKVKDEDRTDSYGYAQAWGKLIAQGLVCAAFSPDGSLLAVGQGGETGTGRVHLVDVAGGEIVRTVSGHQYGVCDLAFSADGQYLLSCGRDTLIKICQVADGKEVASLGSSRGGQFKDWLHALAISPDQRWVAAADIAGLIHVWRLAQ